VRADNNLQAAHAASSLIQWVPCNTVWLDVHQDPLLPSPLSLPPGQARRMLAKRLPVPAYDMLLKCSHAFNVLDARGAVGVTERADCFATMRALAREVTGE